MVELSATSVKKPLVLPFYSSINLCLLFFICSSKEQQRGELLNEIFSLPVPGCERWAVDWTGDGPAELGSCSRGRLLKRHCPAGSPPLSNTGCLAEAGWSPVHFHRDPWGQAEGRRRAAVS